MKPHRETDGELFARWKVEGGQLVRTIIQPREDRILDDNSELRKSPDALIDLDWGRWMLSIPENVRLILGKKYPELDSPDPEIRTRAWVRFMATPEADPYRVRDRVRRPRL